MEVLFLGTAASEGIPAVFCDCEVCKKARELGGKDLRTRSSVLIDEKYLVDLTPDTFSNALRFNLELTNVQHLFITHSHEDHFYAKELINRTEPFAHIDDSKILSIYANSKVISEIERTVNVQNARIRLHKLEYFETYKGEDFTITPLPAQHATDQAPFVYFLQINGKNIFYGHDSGWYPEETFEFLKNNRIDLAIFDCTYGKDNFREWHMGIEPIVEIKRILTECGSMNEDSIAVATHFSHNGGLLHNQFEEILGKEGFVVAYDGLKLML